MAQPPSKILRVGIFQGDRCIEERLIRKRTTVTIGQTLSNTFVVPTSAMPKTWDLFEIHPKGHYILRFTERMGGRLSVGEKGDLIDLTRPRAAKGVQKTKNGDYFLNLTDHSRGKITIGDTRILFNFVSTASTVRTLPRSINDPIRNLLRMVGGPLIGWTLLALLLQIVPLQFVIITDWIQPSDYAQVPDWEPEVVMQFQDPEKEKEEKPEEPEEKSEEEKSAEVEEVPAEKPVEAKVEKKKPKKSVKRLAKTPKARTRHKTKAQRIGAKKKSKALISSRFAIDGGTGGVGAAIGDNQSHIAMKGLSNLDFDSTGRASTGAASLGAGTPGGNGNGTGDVKSISTKNGSAIGTTGPSTTGKPPTRKKIKLKLKMKKAQFKGKVAPADKKSIEGAFKRYKKQVEKCYRRLIQSKGEKDGKLVVQFSIDGSGKVAKIKIVTNSVHKDLGRCVEGKAKKWRFPKTGKKVMIRKSWVFGN